MACECKSPRHPTVRPKPRAVYRYADHIVAVEGGQVKLLSDHPMRHFAKFFNPLPSRYRKAVQADARKRERAERLKGLNVRDAPWTDLGAVK